MSLAAENGPMGEAESICPNPTLNYKYGILIYSKVFITDRGCPYKKLYSFEFPECLICCNFSY